MTCRRPDFSYLCDLTCRGEAQNLWWGKEYSFSNIICLQAHAFGSGLLQKEMIHGVYRIKIWKGLSIIILVYEYD